MCVYINDLIIKMTPSKNLYKYLFLCMSEYLKFSCNILNFLFSSNSQLISFVSNFCWTAPKNFVTIETPVFSLYFTLLFIRTFTFQRVQYEKIWFDFNNRIWFLPYILITKRHLEIAKKCDITKTILRLKENVSRSDVNLNQN